jgi:hypothetical protein
VPGLYPVKSFPSNFGRPRADIIQKPKRSSSLPINFELSSWVKTASASEVRAAPKRSLTRKKMDELSDTICDRIEKHLQISDPPWLWCTYVKELLKNQNVKEAIEEARKDNPGWKNSTPCLTAFVRDHASQLFAMLVYLEKIKLIDRFCEKGMGDVMFPVKLLEDSRSIESTKGDSPVKLEFGSQLRFKDAKDLFANWQWQFFVPELRWRPFECPAFDPGCQLPFLEQPVEITRSQFSIVYEAVAHCEYIAVESNGLVSTQASNLTFCQSTGFNSRSQSV